MSYSKPEVATLGNSVELVQGQCKGSSHTDLFISGNTQATVNAYEADE